MAEKDVKKAKKLYAKMKKEQKAQNRQESPATADKDAESKEEERDASAVPEQSPAIEDTSDPSTSAEPEAPANSSETVPEPASTTPTEAEEKSDKQPTGESSDDVKEPETNASKEPETKPDTDDKPSPKPESAKSDADEHLKGGSSVEPVAKTEDNTTGAEETTEAKAEAENKAEAKEEAAEPIEKAEAEDKTESTGPVPDEKAEDGVVAKDNKSTSQEPASAEKQQQQPSVGVNDAPDSSAEVIAELKGENDDLRAQVKKLENRVLTLESELAAARSQHTEISLSPPQLPQGDNNISSQRNRASSFVEADLYSESEKVSDRREQMKKWKGFQLDLRSWRRPLGIGEVLTI